METITIFETTIPVTEAVETTIEEIISESATETTAVVETTRDFWTPEGGKETLPIMGKGMFGIFIVMGIIILCVSGLNRLGSKPKKDKTK